MPAATSLLDPLDRDHVAQLIGHASELRRALTVVAERIATRRSDAAQIQRNAKNIEASSVRHTRGSCSGYDLTGGGEGSRMASDVDDPPADRKR